MKKKNFFDDHDEKMRLSEYENSPIFIVCMCMLLYAGDNNHQHRFQPEFSSYVHSS